ncbi:alkyl hydroperoxide reductase/ thiol specific antioxidant/ Mal allergen [Galbibacter marinus]|uniref:Alkyl hydroperoxide reductase/ thiol specific antioxidant/ Mal allergen n=1 Tax=Galbibacter marinus TaxID=555500 RepID=K2PWR5_9FLAO|nr:TlpA disulfide reductase family protein [Galbibacter marinus]EKF55909.1 alkyl hydroperoxide reductase/ thiol specific antioxidant/ Mal allergen [Galbibacter marinus]
MKFKIIALFNLLFIIILGCTDEKIIKLPLTTQEGYGAFQPAFGLINYYSNNENDPWKKTNLTVLGIPEDWTDVRIGHINTDIHQSVYQNFHLGNITMGHYKRLQNTWNWEPDSLSLSKKPIACKIAFAYGKDRSGELTMIVDTNNNRDLSDDNAFAPIEIIPSVKPDYAALAKKGAVKVHYERMVNNEIVQLSTPLLIAHIKKNNILVYNFAQFATTKLDNKTLAIQSNSFRDLAYHDPEILKIGKDGNVVTKDEFLEIGNEVFKNLGVNKNENVLILERMVLPKNQLYSTQIGFKAIKFSGKQFKKDISISLDDLKGKYVLLDFWATWCAPCIEEIPTLRELYEKTSKSNFEIISIVGDSPIESLEQLIKKHSISWPQIISNDLNLIKEKYHINGYPTTYLLNPEGEIIAKNLRAKDLKDKIRKLIDQQITP